MLPFKVIGYCQIFENYLSYPFTFIKICWTCSGDKSGLKLTYCDLRNMVHFSFPTMLFFPPSQKITTPKYDSLCNKQSYFFLLQLKTIYFNIHVSCFMRTVLLLLRVNVNCFKTRFFSLIQIASVLFLINLDYMLFFCQCIYILSTVL